MCCLVCRAPIDKEWFNMFQTMPLSFVNRAKAVMARDIGVKAKQLVHLINKRNKLKRKLNYLEAKIRFTPTFHKDIIENYNLKSFIATNF